jgi:hypothetical protein
MMDKTPTIARRKQADANNGNPTCSCRAIHVLGSRQTGGISTFFASKVRKADHRANQQEEHDEFQVLQQKGSH